MGGRHEERTLLPGSVDAAHAHELPFSDQSGDGEAVRHPFAESRQVGVYAEVGLGALQVPAEAGDHLVEDEESAAAMRDRLRGVQEILGIARTAGARWVQ